MLPEATDPGRRTLVAGHLQLTDIHLLGLAAARGGCLATFDRTISAQAVKGATPDDLEVIAPGE